MSEARATMRARFVAEMGHVGIPLVVGFALCQVWLSLCFFAPQLFPQNASVKVYEISLVVSAVSLLPAFVRPKRFEALLENGRAILGRALCASVGTLMIPFSSGDSMTDMLLQLCAGVLTGLASGWLFVAWYQAFCKAGDLIGFVLGSFANSLFMYLFTTVAYLPDVSPWIMVFVACAAPIASAVLLVRCPVCSSFASEVKLPARHTKEYRSLVVLCCSIFFVSFVDEFMRNFYLEGSDLQFYSGSLNLVLVVVKTVSIIMLVAIIASHGHQMSLAYRFSLLLTMTAVLLMPYVQHWPYFMYGITNFGAFLFKTMISILAFNFCRSYRIAPLLVFSLTRIAFSLDLLLGFVSFKAYQAAAPGASDLLGLLSVAMGLLVVTIYSFVFTDRYGASLFAIADAPDSMQGAFSEKCDRIAQVGRLSKREADVLRLIAKGRSTPRIQEELSISVNTVNSHTSHIYQKLGIHSRQELLDLLESTAPASSE